MVAAVATPLLCSYSATHDVKLRSLGDWAATIHVDTARQRKTNTMSPPVKVGGERKRTAQEAALFFSTRSAMDRGRTRMRNQVRFHDAEAS
jgi:hypothetical protein